MTADLDVLLNWFWENENLERISLKWLRERIQLTLPDWLMERPIDLQSADFSNR
jgi:hypothetical protein